MPDIRNSPVLDDCQRPDEDPLSFDGKWRIITGGRSIWNLYPPGGLSLDDYSITHDAFTFGGTPNGIFTSYWVPGIFHDNVECWARAGTGFDLSESWLMFINLTSPENSMRGYQLGITANVGEDTWTLARHDGFDSVTVLLMVGEDTYDADPLGANELCLLRYAEGTLSAWRDHNTDGATWSQVMSVFDDTYPYGHLGLGTGQDDSNPSWNEFGGGVIRHTQIYRYVTN